MHLLVTAHFVAAMVAPAVVKRWHRQGLLAIAALPALSAVWIGAQAQTVWSETPLSWHWQWVPGLELAISFRLDPLAWLMSLIITGVGALVMIYASRYFEANAKGLGRFTSFFTAFAGAMIGLVSVDHLMMLYLFWEGTTVFSFLLIGHHFERRYARAAARQAIHVTSTGSLAMFAGFVMIANQPGGTYRISALIEAIRGGLLQPNTPVVIVAALLIMFGAASKSALVPNHFWLPGAMAAPTPVSAYLHAAAMVKAGIYLIARLTPGFTTIPGWSPIITAIGLATMIVGGYRALRQFDLKLILAFGTVSQLGLMAAAFGYGTAATATAGYALLIAHALFKSALFMSVGLVEKTTGTRDLRELNGLRSKKPVLALATALSAASMAALPCFLGFLGKEALFTAVLHPEAAWLTRLGRPEITAAANITVVIVLVLGAALTVAYSWRYWWGAFARKRTRVEMNVTGTPKLALTPICLLALTSATGIYYQWLDKLTVKLTETYAGHGHLALWSGTEPAALTALSLGLGIFLAWQRPAVARLQRRFEPRRGHITDLYRWMLLEIENLASRVTAATQRGSLPADVSTILVVLTACLLWALSRYPDPQIRLRLWDSPLQLGIVTIGITAAIITARARHRMKAVLALGAVGSSLALLYMSYGAPDLALTQIVVEVVTLAVFVLVLRSLPTYFSDRPLVASRWIRLAIAAAAGISVSLAAVFAIQARTSPPISNLIPAEAYVFGAGKNVVNVILVDVRAWDTVGELSVLLVTATGVASLIYLNTRFSRPETARPTRPGRWLPAVALLPKQERSVLLEVGTRLMFPTMIVASLWLTLIGHNYPGGGFAGGLMAGLAVVLRYLAGGRFELGQTLGINPGRLLGLGLFTAAVGGALPLLFGQTVLQSANIDINLGWFGHLHFTSALILDIGVYILVLALAVDLITALGAQIDRDREESSRRLGPGVPL